MDLGIDIGSVSLNSVLMGAKNEIVEEQYVRLRGEPAQTTLAVWEDIVTRTSPERIDNIVFTGTAGKRVAKILNAAHFNEIAAQSRATAVLYPHIRTIIEIGGEDSKLILLDNDSGNAKASCLQDFAMNTVCAAGTGSFIDQQAARLGLRIEEFGELVLRSKNPPRIAGRCSVFAKSDMTHLQQVATPEHDIVAGLCFALARNFSSTIAKGKELERPVSFQGGVAANVGMIAAFRSVLDMDEGELFVPPHYASMGAIGAVLMMREKQCRSRVQDFEPLRVYLGRDHSKATRHPPLPPSDHPLTTKPHPIDRSLNNDESGKLSAFLGIDVGSISTNLAVLDSEGRVLARRYLRTAGRPLTAVQNGLEQIGAEIGDLIKIRGVGVTGSGRSLTGDFVGADIVRNEITAHAHAAVFADPKVDTIFEIGGQDSKYIRLENGVVVDFSMNKVCAAGTGSFLEEQAERLDISIKEEFGELALNSKCPTALGDRCTVFMESEINHYQQLGEKNGDLVAGLCYSIVSNYIHRVVEDRPIGEHIFFQGGTAYNRGVKAAFEQITGRPVTVPQHHDIMGAIGAALLAADNSKDGSKFKGFDLSKRSYEIRTFTCSECPNDCEIREVQLSGEHPMHYGGRCGKYDETRSKRRKTTLPRLFDEREKFLAELPEGADAARKGPTIGIPRTTTFFELFPFWNSYFTSLGCQVVPSDNTGPDIIHAGTESVAAEFCFPIKVGHGHLLNLVEKQTDYIFLPVIVNMEPLASDSEHAYNCPYVQSLPALLRSALDLSRVRLLQPTLHMQRGKLHVRKRLRSLAKTLGFNAARSDRAVEDAYAVQERFHRRIQERGQEVLDNLPANTRVMVIVSRPYNGCDDGLNLKLPKTLRDMGVLAMPLDFLPSKEQGINGDFPDMYWRYGQRVLEAARTISEDPRLSAIYLTNFGCGPDSFILKYFGHEMGDKPFLTLEVDEHSADAGAITRCEAFLDSLDATDCASRTLSAPLRRGTQRATTNRKIYVPFMDDHSHIIVAAMRRAGLRAEMLPMADESSLEMGRSCTTGKECYPCIITTGDILKKTKDPDFDPAGSTFFMPSACGPCRFGQYNRFHRIILDDHGCEETEIFALDQTKDYDRHMRAMGAGFRRTIWQAALLVDHMQKLQRQTRPYEQRSGETDRVFATVMQRLSQAVESGENMAALAHEIWEAFRRIPVQEQRNKPLIGVVGEIYVRANPFSNRFIIKRIEKLGGEVCAPPAQEWLNYIDFMRQRDHWEKRNFKPWLAEFLKHGVQQYDLRRMHAPFKKTIEHFGREESTRQVLRRSRPYIDDAVRGETVLSMGRCEEYAEKKFNGIVNVTPFNCLPGNIVNGLLRKFSQRHPHIPILKLAFDGTYQASEETRLEAFMDQTQAAATR